MPPKIKNKIPSKTKKGDDAELIKVTAATSKLKVTTPNKPYSLSIADAYMVKYYTHKFVDYAEVEFFVPGYLPQHGYQVKLSPDGMAMIWKRAIPDGPSIHTIFPFTISIPISYRNAHFPLNLCEEKRFPGIAGPC